MKKIDFKDVNFIFLKVTLICTSMVAESGLHANIKVIKYSKEIFDLNLNFNWNLNQFKCKSKNRFQGNEND